MKFRLLSSKREVQIVPNSFGFVEKRVAKWPIWVILLSYVYIYIYIVPKTIEIIWICAAHNFLRSLRPEIEEFAGRAGEDRAVEDRAGEDMAEQGRVGGHIKSGQSKSRAGRGQKAGQGMMGIVQYG